MQVIQAPLPDVQPGAKVEAKVEFKAKVGGRADGRLTRGEGRLCRELYFDSEGERRP